MSWVTGVILGAAGGSVASAMGAEGAAPVATTPVIRWGRAGLFLLLGLCPPGATADAALEQWRQQGPAVQALAENDIPAAHAAVLRMQESLPAHAPPADRAYLLNLLAQVELRAAETELAAGHIAQAKAIASAGGDRIGLIEADLNLALNGVNQGDIGAVASAVEEALVLLEGVDRPALLAEAMVRASMIHRRLGRLEASVVTALRALEIARESGDPIALAHAEQGLAVSFNLSARYEQSREHYQRMLTHAREARSRLLEGAALLGLGDAEFGSGQAEEGERRMGSAIALFRATGGPFYLTHAQFSLAYRLAEQGREAEALALLDEVVALYRQRHNPIGLWWALDARSGLRQQRGDLSAAQEDAARAAQLAATIRLPLYRSKSAERLALLAAGRGEHEAAFQLLREAKRLSEQMQEEERGNRILELTRRLESEAQQRHIDQLTHLAQYQEQQQRWLLTLVGGSLLLLLGTVAFSLRLRRSREEVRRLNTTLAQRVEAQTAELRQQASYLRTLVDTLPMVVWLKDPQGRYRAINASITGYTMSEVIGKSDQELWPGRVAETLSAADREVIETGRRVNLELLIPDRDGEASWHEIDKAPVLDHDGSLLGIVGVSRVIHERKAMEQALRESRQMLAEAQRIAHIGSWELDLKSGDPNWSEELYRIAEIEPALHCASYEALLDQIHPEDREAVRHAFAESLERREPFDREYRLLFKDGRVKYVHGRGESYCDEAGRPTRALGTVQEITERKEAERRLEEALEFSQGVINAIPDLLFELDREGRYLNVWTHRPTLLPAPRQSLLGSTVAEVLAPESAAALLEALREAEEQEVSFGKLIRVHLPEGERWFELSVSRKPGGTPSDPRFLVLSRDVTRRLLAEAELTARERELRALAESSPGMMGNLRLKPDGSACLSYASPNIVELFGLRPEEVAEDATPLLNLCHPDDAQRVWETILESARTMTPWRQEYRILHPTKGERWMQGHSNPLPHPEGGVIWYGYVSDITELKQSQAALEAALAEARRLADVRSQFLAQMSHELRTPLNGILGYAQILGNDRRLAGRQQAQVAVIRESGEHLLTLINDILDFARSESGRLELSFSEVWTERFVRSVAGIIRVKAEERGLEFITALAPELPGWVRVDEKRLRQVLLNLLSNAVKFTERGAVVLTVTAPDSGRLRFEIRDSGIGIAADRLEAIFQPFEQVGERRYRFGGTGLGLAISRDLVRLMGGEIQVESSLGKGSLFRFEIECAAREAPQPAPVESAITGSAGARRRVLVVDEVPENRALEWRHETPGGDAAADRPLIAPPAQRLDPLLQLARMGDMHGIDEALDALAQADDRYDRFCRELRYLAQGYQSRAVLTFIRKFQEEGAG